VVADGIVCSNGCAFGDELVETRSFNPVIGGGKDITIYTTLYNILKNIYNILKNI
jgi:hypothetical protein